MRIIITFYYDFLRKKTAAVDIDDEEQDCSILLRAISTKVDRPLHEIVAIFKKDSIPVKIIQGWPLSFYEIKDKSSIHVEFKDNENSDEVKKKGNAMSNRYLMKLGINKQEQQLSVIKDFEEDEEQDQEGVSSSKNISSMRKPSFRFQPASQVWRRGSSRSGSSSSDDETYKNLDNKKMLDNFLESVIWEIKNNRIEDMRKLFSDLPEKMTEEQQKMLQTQRLKVLDQLGNDGFSPLHHAVQQKNLVIVQELLNKGVNVNVPNRQGWTSIQIAIHKNDLNCLKLLLTSETVSLNEVSQVGTPVTVACQLSKPQALALLLEKQPDISVTDISGKTCFDLCSSEECRTILKSYQKSQAIKESDKLNQEVLLQKQLPPQQQAGPEIFLPPRPPLIKGDLYKIGAMLFNVRPRYFVLNADEGTLIRYKSVNQYPLRPLEVIPLKHITHIQIIERSWFMSSDYTYFEINYPTRQVLAAKHHLTAILWVQYLFQASVYSYYHENTSSFAGQIEENTAIELRDVANQPSLVKNRATLGGSILEAIRQYDPNGNNDKRQMATTTTIVESNNHNNNNENPNSSNNNQGEIIKPNKSAISNTSRSTNKPNLKTAAASSTAQAQPLPKSSTNNNKPSGNNQTQSNRERSPSPNGNEGNSRNSTQIGSLPEDPTVDLEALQDEKVTFDSFQILKVLGQGSFGKVFLAKKKDTEVIYAIKALKKRPLIAKRQLRYAVTEANVLKMCNHPFVLGLHFALQTPNYLYLVVDYCSGGDISSHLAYKQKFTEEEAVFYIAELVLAIQHIHEKDVLYRDLKPENILICGDGHIKLADFGLSKDKVTDQAITKSFCGTPAYLSPEMLNNKGATKASDIYGIGAVLFEMLTGDPPYYNDDIPTMYKKIKEGNLSYPSYVSQKAKNFINGLLDRNPKTRLGANDKEQIKRDPFFEGIDWDKLYKKEYQPPITEFENSDIEDEFDDIVDKRVFQDLDYEQHNKNINRVKQFSFVRKQ